MTLVNLAKSETLSDRVATQILVALAERRQSQNALARAMGVPAMWVSDRMSGKTQITLNDLARIAGTLGVAVGDLLPKIDRGDTRPYVSPTSFPAPRNPLKGIAEPKRPTRTGRTMADPSIGQPAQRTSARSSRQLQPCG